MSDTPGTLELRELSLAISTPEGIVIVVGCSHPGIDKIVAAASTINPRVHLIAGAFHLLTAGDSDIDRIVTALHDQFKVDYIAPGHCTGEPAFTERLSVISLCRPWYHPVSEQTTQVRVDRDRYWFVGYSAVSAQRPNARVNLSRILVLLALTATTEGRALLAHATRRNQNGKSGMESALTDVVEEMQRPCKGASWGKVV